MKTSTFYNKCIALLFLLLFTSGKLFAQHQFATTQVSSSASLLCLGCVVTNPNSSIDGNLQTASTLNVAVGVIAQTYQELIFPGTSKVAAGTPVTIKMGTGNNLLDATVLGSISITPYNGNSPAGPTVSAATLLTALSNNNQFDIMIIPAQVYDRVRVTLNGGLLGALSTLLVYEAYYTGNNAASCNVPFDELHGISAGLLNLGVDLGGVVNPQNAIDGNINTASTLNAGVNVLGAYAQQTIIFEQTSVLGDSVRLTIAIPPALLDAGVLSSISLSTFNGNTNNNDAVFLSSALLNVRLLDFIGTRRKVTVTYVPSKLFDRVQLRLGSVVANVLSSLNLYEVEKLIPRPIIKVNGVITNNTAVCAGSAAALTVAAVPNTTFTWYTQATGGTAIAGAGAAFTTPALNATTTYYVAASRTGCTNQSERTAVVVTVNQVPAAPVIVNNAVTICPGATATFTAANVPGVTISWFANPTGGTPLFTGNSYTTAALALTSSFYAEATAGGTCVSPTRTKVTATISPLPATPLLTTPAITICDGDVVILSIATPVAGQTYNWYSTATGGTVLFTGTNFTTPALHANTSYFAEAVSVTGCAGSSRVQGTVTVTPKPVNPVLAANNLTVSAGQSAAISVTNAQTGITYNWYTSATAATPVFTGNPYQTPLLYTTTTYYVGAVNSTGCQSVSRTAITISVTINNNSPCTFANQQTNVVNGICIGCATANPALATDADTTTASTITVLAGLLNGYAEQTMQFQQPGFAGDTIKLVLQTPVGLADIGLLSQIQVSVYNGATLVNAYTLDNALIKLRLLGGANRYAVYVPATGAYDRVSIRLTSGVATLLTSLQVYYAIQQYPKPVFNPIAPEVCKGSTAVVNITSPLPATGTFNWFTTPVGGVSVHTGTSFTTPVLNANTTYYIEYSRGSCVSTVRYPVQITVDNPPLKPVVVPVSASINAGQTATFKATAATNAIIKWYTTATGGTSVFTGSNFTTPALSANTIYYAEAVLGNCVSPDRTVVPVTVVPLVIPNISVTPPTQAVNAGTSAILTASSTTPGTVFNWYTTPTGGTSIFTGATFTTPPVFTGANYYAEAVVTATGAISATRAQGIVTVNATANNPVPCDAAIDQTNNTSGLLCVLCGISNATGSVDANTNSFSQLAVPVGLLGGYAQQTLRFANTGRAGDSVIVELGIPGALASVGVLSQISLATYNGTSFNNDRFAINGSLISINLLSGTSRFRVVFKAAADFDRVEIRLNSGVAGVLNALNIYDASQEVAAPVIVSAAGVTACAGTQTTLTATVPAYVTVKWYTTATGGTPVFTGAVFNTPVLGSTTTYYAEASRTADGCTQAARTPVTVTVTPTPLPAVVAVPTVTICAGSPATFAVTPVSGVTFNWFTTPTRGTAVHTGNSFTTGALSQTTLFYIEAQGAATCASPTRTMVTANVTATPLVPVVSQTPVQTCSGSSAVLTASSTQPGVTFNWYTAASGGTPVFTGAQFTTPALNTNTSYYVEAAAGSCVSSTRAKTDVVVNPTPVAPTFTVTPANAQIQSGQTAVIHAASTTAGATFNWYTAASGGTPIFTGATFTTPALTSNMMYYAESTLAATGCISTSRTAINIIVNPIFSTSCDFASTQVFSVVGGVACLGCTVNNPNNAVDTDTTNVSQLTLPVSLAGSSVAQQLIFGDTGNAGDTVSVKIGLPVSLLTAGVLDRLQIASYNGGVYNGDRINLSSGLISIRLLAGNTSAVIRFAPKATYDRIEITLLGGVASILNSANVYYASKQVETPKLAASTENICSGSTALFTVSNAKAGVTYKWYTLASGGSLVHTGATFTTPALLTTTTYYVESSRTANSCVNPNRVAATANVTLSPVNPILAQTNAEICAGDNVTLSVTNGGSGIVKWYDAASNGTLLFTGANYTVTPVTNMVYYAELSNSTCTSPARTTATVKVNARPSIPGVTAANVQVCLNSTAVLSILTPEAGVTYSWYTSATGGTVAGTGVNFTTPSITQNVIYYTEASNTVSGCINNGGRTSVNVFVSGTLTAPVLSASNSQICSGGSVTVSVNTPAAGLFYNWYTTTTGGTPVFTGTTFTINNLLASVDYYVETANSGGCVSAARTKTTITVLPIPVAPVIQAAAGGLSACNGSDISINIANPQADLVYRWYNAATGGTLLFTGTVYTTPAITATTTYFVEAASAGNCNPSARTPVTVTLSPLPPDPAVTLANVAVCAGSNATLSVQSPQAGTTYTWYDSPAMTTLLFTGSTYVTGPILTAANFYVSASNTAGCSSNNLALAQVTVQPPPSAPVVTGGNTVQTCTGSKVTLSIDNPVTGFTYNWYSTALGATPLFTDNSFVTPVLIVSTTYYAEAVNNVGCASTTRTSALVTILTAPEPPSVSAEGTAICPGTSATLNGTILANTTISWYAAATGGTPLFTGNSFITPVLNANTTYYADATSSTGSCTSGSRTAVTVTILQPLNSPDVTVSNTTISTITFAWGAVAGAVGYEVSFDNGVTFAAPSSGSAGLTQEVTDLKPNESRTIIVRATGASACELGANSAAVTGTTNNPLANGIFVPNAFTPNGDGNNDLLLVFGNTIQSINLSVYDQWGELQFRTTNKLTGWDGTYKGRNQPVGVYVWYLTGTTTDGQQIKKKGTVTLLR